MQVSSTEDGADRLTFFRDLIACGLTGVKAPHLRGTRPARRGGRRDLPKEIWKQIWSNNSTERLNREVRRRTDVVGIFPNRDSIVRLVGAVLAEQLDEEAELRRYLGLDALARARRVGEPITEPEEIPEPTTEPPPHNHHEGSRANGYTTQMDLTSAERFARLGEHLD